MLSISPKLMIRCKRRNRILIQEEGFIDEAEQSNHTASDCNNDMVMKWYGNEMTLAIAAARLAKDFLLQNALRPRSIGRVNSQRKTKRSGSRFHKPVVCSMPPTGKNFNLRFLYEYDIPNVMYFHIHLQFAIVCSFIKNPSINYPQRWKFRISY